MSSRFRSRFICSCSTPMTIAIQGGWGTGKTSMMQMIADRLQWIRTAVGSSRR
ncbi:P-loop NTPase fold protein [Candidatus Darwinibacter acetoxidans]|nr:hypothetical protein [Bacillota bacterium]